MAYRTHGTISSRLTFALQGSQKEKREKGAENFPDLEKRTHIQFQEAQSVPIKINPKRPLSRHIDVKIKDIQKS